MHEHSRTTTVSYLHAACRQRVTRSSQITLALGRCGIPGSSHAAATASQPLELWTRPHAPGAQVCRGRSRPGPRVFVLSGAPFRSSSSGPPRLRVDRVPVSPCLECHTSAPEHHRISSSPRLLEALPHISISQHLPPPTVFHSTPCTALLFRRHSPGKPK